MAELVLREYEKAHIHAMKKLWADCFGDPQEYIDAFISLLPQTGTALVAEHEGRLCAGAYIIDDMTHISPAGSQRCALIYAVSVDKAFRGAGLGGRIVREAVELAKKRGSVTVTILPAEDSLYGWYEKCAGFQCRLYRKELIVEAADLAMVEKIDFARYAALREKLLTAGEYVHFGPGALKLEEELCRIFGGALYHCAGSVAAAYVAESATGIIHELLCPAGHDAELIAAALAFEMGCEQAKLLLPGSRDEGEKYLAAIPCEMSESCYWPFAFD